MSSTDLASPLVSAPPVIFVPSTRGGAPVAVPDPRLDAWPPPKLIAGTGEPALKPTGALITPDPPTLVFPKATVNGSNAASAGNAAKGSSQVAASSSSGGASQAASAPATSGGTLRKGDSGPEVEKLQAQLNSAGAKPPLKVDGDFGPATERALKAFQSSHGLASDGVAGPRTQRALSNAKGGASGSAGASPKPNQPQKPKDEPPSLDDAPTQVMDGDFCFPLAFKPSPDWHTGARYFGARRNGGKRLHAGCDLLGPKGTQIYAIADGTLVRAPYYFYSGTHAVEIRHGQYIVRYGEILPGSYTGGKHVKKGQPICKIGRLNSGSSMLHFEMYSNGASSAPLTVGTGPYKRRADLMNPTKMLDEWARNLPRR